MRSRGVSGLLLGTVLLLLVAVVGNAVQFIFADFVAQNSNPDSSFSTTNWSAGIAAGTLPEATGTSANMTMSKPSGLADGHLLLASLMVEDTAAVTAPSGWVLLRSRVADFSKLWVYSKVIADSSTEPASYTFTGGGSNDWIGKIVPISGADATTPVEGSTVNGGTSASPTATGLTTGGSGRLLVAFAGMDFSENYTPPTGMTELDDRIFQSISFTAAWVSQPSAGPSGNKVFTATGSDVWAAVLVSVKP